MSTHIPGLELARGFYHDVVEHLVRPPHAAALVGEGSEVLGYDQARSTDHAWGPRVQIFVDAPEIEQVSQAIERGLPETYRGYPVRFYAWETDSVRHHVEVTTLQQWLTVHMRMRDASELTSAKWLSIPQQHLLQCTAGAVFRDDLGELLKLRQQLSWYPADIWLWMMGCQWHLIGNIQHLVGRTIETSDARGASLIASRLVRSMMELCFLQERRYWPYLKWFGTAFSKLHIASRLGPIFDAILYSTDHETKANEINNALKVLAERHNALGLTPVVPPKVDDFQVGINHAVRPYRVLNAGDFAIACVNAIQDTALRQLHTVGSIDQLTHADDLLINFTTWPQQLEQIYEQMTAP
ncbi:DUF4037 domain-containing protein [Alicyclobacillus acidiphilus]|uniref:DUF4037 domain-containing protein n=1 Tax=Alicyclobacillus acidiphilus TaxID=182455 RepID=UPI0008300C29|nr:DUF4037 domain-containing protein [Alicyclobacillus acidiphilus]